MERGAVGEADDLFKALSARQLQLYGSDSGLKNAGLAFTRAVCYRDYNQALRLCGEIEKIANKQLAAWEAERA